MRPSNRSRPADSRKIWGQTGFAQNYRKLNEPPRPRLQRNGTIYLMARPPLLCQGGDFAFPAGCPRRPCPADDLWVTLNCARRGRYKSFHYFGKLRVGLARSALSLVRDPGLCNGSEARLRRSLSRARISAVGTAFPFASGTFFFSTRITRLRASASSLPTGGSGYSPGRTRVLRPGSRMTSRSDKPTLSTATRPSRQRISAV